MEDEPGPSARPCRALQEFPAACLLAFVRLTTEGKEKMFLILGVLALIGFLLAAVEWDGS